MLGLFCAGTAEEVLHASQVCEGGKPTVLSIPVVHWKNMSCIKYFKILDAALVLFAFFPER